jgi:hypothetical protein
MPTTNPRGKAKTGYPSESEISGMHCMISKIRKYVFALFESYIIKFRGKNDIIEYFEVVI